MVLTLHTRFALSFTGSLLVSAVLFLLSTPAHHAWLYDFFITDLPPLHGSIRILAYTGVLLISLTSYISRPPFGDSPLQAPELFRYTLPSFFSLEGAMALLGRSWITYQRLQLIRDGMLVAWLMCILGLGGQTPPVVFGLGTFVLHGVVSGCIGTSHRWYVPVYTSLALMFANGNDTLSLDGYLHSLWPDSYPFPPHSPRTSSLPSVQSLSVLDTGFARKLVLIASIATLFYGGVTKLLNGGWKWLNGRSLAYYVSSEENGRWGLLKQLMHTQPLLSLFLSVSSILLECGAIIALFDRWWRPIVLLNAAAFHFGIWLTMWPNYAPQTWCYGIGTQWPWERLPAYPPLASPALLSARTPMYQLLASGSMPSYMSSSVFVAACCGCVVCVFLSMVTLFRIEYWPLTGIPMYSFYRDMSFSYRHLRDEAQAQYVAVEHCNSGYPNALAWSNLWIILRLKNTAPGVKEEIAEAKRRRKEEREAAGAAGAGAAGRSGGSKWWRRGPEVSGSVEDVEERWYVNLKVRVTRETAPYGVLTKQWRRTLHNVAAQDMAAKPRGRIHAPKEGEGAIIEAEESEGELSQGETELEGEPEVKESPDADDEREDEPAAAPRPSARHRSTRSTKVDPKLPPSLSSSPRPSPRAVYPGERWLLEQRANLRRYAMECDWQLPAWAERTGELQLRCKLRHGYAVLARCPWNSEAATPTAASKTTS